MKTFTVQVWRPDAVGGEDDWGDPGTGATHEVAGCWIAPRSSSEREDQRDTVIVGLSLFAPHGADIRARDVVTLPVDPFVPIAYQEKRWRVQGEAGSWANPLTGWTPGVEVALERVTG